MSFSIYLHTNADPVNKIKKAVRSNPTSGTAYTGQLVDGTSIIDPDILVESATPPVGNYAYILEFGPDANTGRYYFIKDIESEKTNLWRLHMHVDVLASFADQILANTAVIARNSYLWNLYLEDSRFKAYANPYIVTKVFPSGFNTFQFVLAMLGGHD